MSQPEARLSAKIIGVLRKQYPGSFWVKIHGSASQRAGLPDIHGTIRGRSVWLETKLPGNKATDIQNYTLNQLRGAGAIVGVVYGAEDALNVILDGLIWGSLASGQPPRLTEVQ